MITAKDGSISDRALVDPDRNNFGPRLGFAYTVGAQDRRPRRLGYAATSTSTASDRRTCSAINGPQVVRAAVVQGDPTAASFRPTEQGYPAGLTDSSKFNPLTALVSYIPRDFHSSPVQSWYVSVQREFGPNMLVDVAYVGNKADDLLLVANYNQAVPNNAAANIPLASRRPIPTFGDITYVFNGGKSRYKAFQAEVRVADGHRRHAPELADAVEGRGQRAPARSRIRTATSRRRRTSTTSTPTSALGPTTSRTTARRASCGRCRSATASAGAATCSTALDVVVGGWQLAGVNTITPGEMVTFTYTPAAPFQVSAITNDFSGANNYRPNITCDPYAPSGRSRSRSGSTRRASSLPTDPSQPFGNAPRNNVRGPNFWQFDLAASKNVALGGQARLQLRLEAFNLFNRVNFTPPAANRSNSTFGTITSTFDQRQVQFGVKVLW